MPTVETARFAAESDGPRLLASSGGLSPGVLAAADELLRMTPPAPRSVDGPVDNRSSAFWVRPLSRRLTVLAQVEGAHARLLFFPRREYEAFGQPFLLDAHFAPDWPAPPGAEPLVWDGSEIAPRTCPQLMDLFKSHDMPLILGAAQALVDGGRLGLVAGAESPGTLAAVWQLLPTALQGRRTVCAVADLPGAGFDAFVTRRPPDPWPVAVLSSEQARDYPHGGYEFALQSAVEHGDEAALARVLSRRPSLDPVRAAVAVGLTALAAGVALRLVG